MYTWEIETCAPPKLISFVLFGLSSRLFFGIGKALQYHGTYAVIPKFFELEVNELP